MILRHGQVQGEEQCIGLFPSPTGSGTFGAVMAQFIEEHSPQPLPCSGSPGTVSITDGHRLCLPTSKDRQFTRS